MYTVEYTKRPDLGLTLAEYTRLTERPSGLVVPTYLGSVAARSQPHELSSGLVLPTPFELAAIARTHPSSEKPEPPEFPTIHANLATMVEASSATWRELLLGRQVLGCVANPAEIVREEKTPSGLIIESEETPEPEFISFVGAPEEVDALHKIATIIKISDSNDEQGTGGYL